MKTDPLTNTGWHRCGNCDTIVHGKFLQPIADIEQRILPGEKVPSGECPMPNCIGALCHPTKHKGDKAPRGAQGVCPNHGAFPLKTADTPCPQCKDDDVEAEMEARKS